MMGYWEKARYLAEIYGLNEKDEKQLKKQHEGIQKISNQFDDLDGFKRTNYDVREFMPNKKN